MDTSSLETTLDKEKALFDKLEGLLSDLKKSAREKDVEKIGVITSELDKAYEEAETLDQVVLEQAAQYARELGINFKEFKFSSIPGGEKIVTKTDTLREKIINVARLSNEAAGVLKANIGILEDTIRVLESLDTRSVGYGDAEKASKAGRPSKMIDRTA